jgi:peroxiredoxin
VHKKAGIDGADIARPAEFLVDRNGIVRWRNLTEDFRVRLRPEQILAAVRALP